MLLQVKNLTAGYGKNEVLRDLSISVNSADVIALIGPNGAGKSTVLKSIVGLTNIARGEILFKNRDISGLPTHSLLEEGIGFVPQGRLIFPTLTVLENLEMGGYLIDYKETLDRNLENVFKHFPVLKRKIKLQAGMLSGGEQQMLAIGRSLMMTPELLMLDEPSLGLSPKITTELFEKLMEINQSGTTLLIVEQNIRLVLRYANKGFLLAAGELKFAGTSEELSDEKLMREAYLI